MQAMQWPLQDHHNTGSIDMNRRVSFKMAAAFCCVLALGACSKKNTDLAAGTGPGAAAVPGSEQDFTVNVGDRVFFTEDMSTLSAEAQETLRRQAQWLQQYPSVVVQVEGHADERGTREYNLALGERRAAAARNFLITQGIEARRIATVSYGKERPQVLGSTEQAWAQNRRGVMLVN